MLLASHLVFLCILTSVSSIHIGIIKNVSLSTNCSYVLINASTCNECTCTILYSSQNLSILSLNCRINSTSSVRCELITGTSYSNSCSYQIQNNSNSIFYFQSLPSISQSTTQVPSLRWNTTGITIGGSAAGTSGATSSLMMYPYSMALDASNNLYVTDYNNNRIQKWTVGASSATTVAGQANGAQGATSSALFQPVGIVLDSNNNMYFTDRGNHRVMYWANNAVSGSVIAGITGSPGSGLNQFNSPSGLIRNETTGTLYIVDTFNHRIMCYLFNASSGTVVAGGNGQGIGVTQLSQPYSFTIDAVTNSFIIVNYGAHTVVRWVFGASSWILLAGVSGISGSSSTLLFSPLSVVLDPYSNMYVSDTNNHRIQFFLAGQSNATTIAGVTGSAGTSSTQLHTPYWAILDNQLNLYVADTYNNRVQKFYRS